MSTLLAMRSFSVVFGALTIACAYLLGSSAFKSRATGVVSALLIAVVGYQIQFSWEARMYTLGTALALFSAWLLLKAIRSNPQRLYWWVAYGLSLAAFAYTHYYTLFSIIAQVLFIAGYILVDTRGRIGEILQSKRVWYALVAGVCLIVLFAPWLPTFIAQSRQVQQAYWIPPMIRWSVPDTFYRMFIPTDTTPPHNGFGMLLGLAPTVFVILSWLLLIFLPERRHVADKDAHWLIVLSAIVPFVISVGLSIFGRSLYQDRYFLFAQLFILIGIAGLLMRLPWRKLRWGVIGVICLGLLVSYVYYWQTLNIARKPGAHAASRYIYTHRSDKAPVIVNSPFVYFAILHYAQEEFHVNDLPKLYSETGELAHFAGGPILKKDDVTGKNIFTSKSTTIWVVDTTGFGGTPLKVPAPWRKASSKTYQEVFPYQGDVTVNEYNRD